MKQSLPKRKMIRYCLSDVAKGLFNGMIGNYLLYFFQPTVKSGLPNLLPQNKLLGFLTIMALLTGRIRLACREDIEAVFRMTPYYFHTSRKDKDKLLSLETLETEIEFVIGEYEKPPL